MASKANGLRTCIFHVQLPCQRPSIVWGYISKRLGDWVGETCLNCKVCSCSPYSASVAIAFCTCLSETRKLPGNISNGLECKRAAAFNEDVINIFLLLLYCFVCFVFVSWWFCGLFFCCCCFVFQRKHKISFSYAKDSIYFPELFILVLPPPK